MKADQCNKKSLFCCVRSFFNRSLSLLLILALLPACLAVPAMADETDDTPYFDLLDYGVSNLGSNTPVVSSGQKISYDLPGYYIIRKADILFTSTASIERLQISFNDEYTADVNVVSLGGGLYRAELSTYFGVRKLSLIPFFSSSGSGLINVLSIKVSVSDFSSVPLSYYGHVYDYSYTPIDETSFSGDGSSPMTPVEIYPNAGREDFEGHISRTYISSWQSFDFVSINIALWSSSFSSLNVQMDGLPVPYEINTVESTDVLGVTLYLLDVLIDVRHLNLSSTSPLLIDVSGSVNPTFTGSFAVRSCLGFVSTPSPSLWTHWFTNLQGWLSSGFSSVASGLSSVSNNISSFISNQTSALSNALSSLGSSISGYISDQTNSLTSSITTFQTNVGTWLSNCTQVLYNIISSWGQQIVDSMGFGFDRVVDAITGGENADDLQNGANQIGEAGSSLGSNIGSIHDFEDQYFGQLDSNMGAIVGAGNITGIVAPLAFVKRYTNLIVSAIPSNFLVIFTLPILLGIFMFMVNHRIKVPYPDRSGDSVTHDVGGRSNDSNS